MRLIRYQTPTYTPAAYPSLLDEMDRLFEAAFPRGGFDWKGQFPVDLYRDKYAFVVRAELPGFRKEDLAIDLADGVLTITGHQKTEKKAEGQEDAKAEPVQERRVTRAIALPENVDVEKIAAAYENGVLTVTLPKREEAKPRQVAIDVK
ncbi:MAG TPA: Hsp20/alpha crystallin family protein [Candidatus Methylacidiphilales bacterium]|jgi:HSP20 family protein|nr:Hsp20/alpha crystallin family protein [Candidatus Methylacidiphilales bacterium]